jgi:hypothetical protein
MEADGVATNSGGVTNVSGSSAATSGQDAHALYVTGTGSTANLSGTNTFTTTGAGRGRRLCGARRGHHRRRLVDDDDRDRGGVSPAAGLGALRRQCGRSRLEDHARWRDDHDLGPRRVRATRERRGGQRDRRVDHGHGNAQRQDDQRSRDSRGTGGNGASILATGGGTIVSAGNAVSFSGGPVRRRPSTIPPSTFSGESSPTRQTRHPISTTPPPTPG